MDWSTILTSAAVGALVAQLVQLAGQWAERRARRRELIFRFAVEAARATNEMTLQVARESNRPAMLKDSIVMAASYYPLVEHVFDKGGLPPDAVPEHAAGEPPQGFSGLR